MLASGIASRWSSRPTVPSTPAVPISTSAPAPSDRSAIASAMPAPSEWPTIVAPSAERSSRRLPEQARVLEQADRLAAALAVARAVDREHPVVLGEERDQTRPVGAASGLAVHEQDRAAGPHVRHRERHIGSHPVAKVGDLSRPTQGRRAILSERSGDGWEAERRAHDPVLLARVVALRSPRTGSRATDGSRPMTSTPSGSPPRGGGAASARRPCCAAPPGPRRPSRARGSRRAARRSRRWGTGTAARRARSRPRRPRRARDGAAGRSTAGRCRGRGARCPRAIRSCVGSSITGRKPAGSSRSSSVLAASFERSRPFGVITTSGRRFGRSAWSRTRW